MDFHDTRDRLIIEFLKSSSFHFAFVAMSTFSDKINLQCIG